MTAFLQASDFIKSLMNLANKLITDFSWDAIPERFRAEPFVRHGDGKVAIRFATEEYKPWIAVGFYYDESNHKVSLVKPNRGIDLILRIAAEPKHTKNIQPALSVLEAKRKELKKTASSVLLKGERGNGNSYSVLVTQECLADVIGNAKTQADQLVAIHRHLSGWLRTLFDDGTLEKAFKKCGLDSGSK